MKKICFIRGSRAEFGLLKSLMQYIQKDKKFFISIACYWFPFIEKLWFHL